MVIFLLVYLKIKKHTGLDGGFFAGAGGGRKGKIYLLCNQLTWLFADLEEYFWEGINMRYSCKYIVMALLREFSTNPGIQDLSSKSV